MSTILVSIISQQTSPNLLFIREKPDVDRYLFISTERMEKEEKTSFLKAAAGISDDRAQTIVVEQNSLDDVHRKLEKLRIRDDDHFIVNITGGTKLMSIGVYSFFREKASEMFYLDIETPNSYLKVFPAVHQKEFPIKHRLGLKEYLTSYGIDLANEDKINATVRTAELTTSFFSAFRHFGDEDHQVLSALREQRNRIREKKSVPLEPEYSRFFSGRWKFLPAESDRLNREEIEYLTGGWFEEYAYNWMKSFLKLEARQIGVNVQIRRAGVPNEFDVLFLYRNTLHLIECKTSIYDSIGKKDIMNETLYKLEALKPPFGLRVKPYIFTLAERGIEKYQIRQSHLDRAQALQVEIVDASILYNTDKRAEMIARMKK